jgi:hypothetical protein
LNAPDAEAVSRPQFRPARAEQRDLIGNTSKNVVGMLQDLPRSGNIEQFGSGRDKEPNTFP